MSSLTKPNIVLIMADDMGYGDMGLFNKDLEISPTPSLDDLSKHGVCFTQGYSASPVCAPARASLMTGRYPHRTGAINLSPLHGLDNLSLDEITIADVLSSNGYATGLVGKWHLGHKDLRYHPNNRGFSEFAGIPFGASDYYDWAIDRNQVLSKSDGRYLTDVFTEEALGFIKRHQSEPFFLYLAYTAPHRPLQAPEEEIAPFAQMDKFNKAVSTIYGMIKRMDKGIGKVLDELKRLDLDKNTIVIFTSDNGPDILGRGQMCPIRYNYNLKGSKYFVYEGGIRIPFILRWSEGISGNCYPKNINNNVIHFTDVFPTLLEAAGIGLPKELSLDGRSFLPILNKEEELQEQTRFWQWNRYLPRENYNFAIRDGDWKLIRPPVDQCRQISPHDRALLNEYPNGLERFKWEFEITPPPNLDYPQPLKEELYNIANDPFETKDLAEEYPQLVASLSEKLDLWFEEVENERKTKSRY